MSHRACKVAHPNTGNVYLLSSHSSAHQSELSWEWLLRPLGIKGVASVILGPLLGIECASLPLLGHSSASFASLVEPIVGTGRTMDPLLFCWENKAFGLEDKPETSICWSVSSEVSA